MTFWLTLGTLLWDGEKKDDREFEFPLNIVAALFMPERDVNAKTALSKEYFKGINYKESQAAEKDGIRYPGSFISEVSINGLYNFLTKPKTAAGNLFLSAGFSTMGMLLWLLPTFLWPGKPLDETDRPFAKHPFTLGRVGVEKDVRRREGDNDDLKVEDRLTSIHTAITVESSFAKVYNRLFCPQCVAKLAVISGVGLTGKMLFWTFVSLLPREDFSPWYIRPFESFFQSKGFEPGLGPLSALQREANFTASSRFQTTFQKRSQDNPVVLFTEYFFSDLLKNVEESIKLVNQGFL